MEEVREQHKNLIGIEMENYAVFAASQEATEPRPMCITAKSVCDYGHEKKKNDFRPYALHTSTKFFWRFLNTPATLDLLNQHLPEFLT
jgi:nucleoside phosphorylase